MSGCPPILWFDTLDSTNAEARRRAEAGVLGPLWIAARHQTAGRGRLDRAWVSEAGNLYATFLMPVPEGPGFATRLSFAAAIGVVRTCLHYVPQLHIGLKWPNDVRVGSAKLSGILVEAGTFDQTCWAAIGIGVNLAKAPKIDAQSATCLAAHSDCPPVLPEVFLSDLQDQMAEVITLARHDFQGLLDMWLEYAQGLGGEVIAGPKKAPINGIFIGLAPDGGLRLQLSDGREHIIRAGDVDLVQQVS